MDASATDPAAALPARRPASARVRWRHSLRTRLMLWSMLTSTVLLVLVSFERISVSLCWTSG